MKRNRLRFVLVVCIFLMCFFSMAQTVMAENLVQNGSFETLDATGMPESWYTDAYVRDTGYTVFKTIESSDVPDGERCALIRNIASNDARYAQSIQVEPESLYHVSCKVKANGVQDGRGANLSIEGLYVFSESYFETEDEWEQIDWYGETGEEQNQVTLFVRLGGYSGESTGEACFDDIRFEKVNAVPGDAIASRWYTVNTAVADSDDSGIQEATAAWPMLVVMSLVYALFSWLYVQKKHASKRTVHKTTIGFVLLGAFLLRLLLSATVQGYMVDVNCFLSWGHTMKIHGPVYFYQATGFCDYPPAYTYILALNSIIADLLKSILTNVDPLILERISFRLIPNLADILACFILYRFARRKGMESVRAFRLITVFAYMPVLVLNSACWGQMDSVLCLVLLIVAIYVIDNRWQFALPLYMLAVLIKPQALMLGFLGLTATIAAWIQDTTQRRKILIGLGGAVLTFIIVVLPFTVQQNPFWLVDQYYNTLASYPYATVNTANFWYIFNGNWNQIGNIAPKTPAILLAIGSVGLTVYYFIFKKEQRLRYLEPIIYAACALFFIITAILSEMTWSLIGTSAMVFIFAIILPIFIRERDIETLPFFGGLLFVLLYVFGIKMHERYIMPAYLLLILSYLLKKDKRILLILLLTSATVFVNEGIVLDNSIRLGSSLGHLNNDTRILAMIVSLINVSTAIFATVTGLSIHKIPKEKDDFYDTHDTGKALSKIYRTWDPGLHWNRKDSILVIGITLIYSVFCFMTLGSTKAPQNPWISSSYEENITIDLGAEKTNFSMLYFCGVSRYDFSVAVSDDGESWGEEHWAQMDQGQCYRWKYLTDYWVDSDGSRKYVSTGSMTDIRTLSGRYIRITAHQIGLILNEIIIRSEDGGILTPVSVQRNNGEPDSPNYSSPDALFDEQDTMEGLPDYLNVGQTVIQPSWYNSTYFDEIYHARTGYEHLHGQAPYETSHPPLGKILMSVGIAVFGMTPFGWRFAGALAGIMMLPGIYLLAKQMTKKTWAAGLAMLMLAMDHMHLTQTQIATIDSFPVLFILFAYFFMLRFLQRDLQRSTVRQILPDLAFSGLFMGLSIASKWIGIYAGAGLAVLFFVHMVRSLVYSKHESRDVFESQLNKAYRVCLWSVLFFVIIPITIYLLSYIPYFAYDHSITSIGSYLQRVWKAQLSMFNYHSTPGLGMDHPFYSPWYEWPLISRPMFYAMKQYLSSNDYAFAIFCFGNPAVWLVGIVGFIATVILYIMNKHYRIEGEPYNWHWEGKDGNDSALFLLIGLAAQFLPWVLVPRGTYIYHYFASIPFLILLVVHGFANLRTRFPKICRWTVAVYTVVIFICFIAFIPYASGILAPVTWLDFLKQFLRIYY